MIKQWFKKFGIAIVCANTLVICGIAIFICGSGRFNQSEPTNATITYGEFPIRLVYEMNGTMYEIEEVIICYFRGMEAFTPMRLWRAELASGDTKIVLLEEENTKSILKPKRTNLKSVVELYLSGGAYFMGDTQNASSEYAKPHIRYSEIFVEQIWNGAPYDKYESTALTNEQLSEFFGIKIIEFTYGEPIVNSFD